MKILKTLRRQFSLQGQRGAANMVLIALLAVVVIIGALAFYYQAKNNAPVSNPAPVAVPHKTATQTSTTPASSQSGDSSSRCHASDLKLTLSPSGAAAGTFYKTLVATNISGTSCTIYGYPGVSLIDNSGKLLGQPATRNSRFSSQTLTLAHAQSVYASLAFPDPGDFSSTSSCSAKAAALQVYPPDETTAINIVDSDQSCPGFSTTAFTAQQP